MSRKSWSNLFLAAGIGNLLWAISVRQSITVVPCITVPACFALAAVARRRMI